MDYITYRKYWKILEGHNIKTINENIINLLIDKNIIVEYTLEPLINEEGNSIDIFLNGEPFSLLKKEDSLEFENYMVFGSKNYKINEDVGIELYNNFECLMEGADDWKMAEIRIELEGIIRKEEKLSFLEKKHSELFSEVKNEPEFLIYTEKQGFNGFDNWKDLMVCEIMSDENLLINYLTNGETPPLDFNELWVKYFQLNDLIKYCKELHSEINENPSNSTTSKGLDASTQVLLLEAIRNYKDWEELSATKKGKIVSLLIGKNADNIKDFYLQIDKKQSENTKKFSSDKASVDTLMKNILG